MDGWPNLLPPVPPLFLCFSAAQRIDGRDATLAIITDGCRRSTDVDMAT
jgi:hypothetical protein